MIHGDNEYTEYSEEELMGFFRAPLSKTLLSWSLTDIFHNQATDRDIDYLEVGTHIVKIPDSEFAVYLDVFKWDVWPEGELIQIQIGSGECVDPKEARFEERWFSSPDPDFFQDDSGKETIKRIGTDHDYIELLVKNVGNAYAIPEASVFCSKIYPTETDQDRECITTFVGALMRRIKAGRYFDFAAIKAEIDMLKGQQDNPMSILTTYTQSPTVRQMVDTYRAEQGKRPLLEAFQSMDFEDLAEVSNYPVFNKN